VKTRFIKFCASLKIGVLLRLIFVANLVDAYLTLMWVDAGVATEANPIMNYLLQQGTEWFLAVKIGAISIACLILWRMRNVESVYIAIRCVSLIAILGYAALIGFHIAGGFSTGVLHIPTDFLNLWPY